MTNEQGATQRCSWCGAETSAIETRCSACGAGLAQREMDELVIPGVTHVEPNLAFYAAQPLPIPGQDKRQAAGIGVIEALTSGRGPVLSALGTIAALAATEYLEGKANRAAPTAGAQGMARRFDAPATAAQPAQQPPPAPAENFDETMRRLDARLGEPTETQ